MLSIITVVVASGAIGVAGYKLVRQCTICQKRLKWTGSCLSCDTVICSGCANTIEPVLGGGTKLQSGGYACPGSCTATIEAVGADLVAKYEAEEERLRARRDRISKVRFVSVNYGGQQKPERDIKLVTDWFKEKSDAEESARTIAVDSYDVDVVWYINTISRHGYGVSESGPTYLYQEWRVEGEV